MKTYVLNGAPVFGVCLLIQEWFLLYCGLYQGEYDKFAQLSSSIGMSFFEQVISFHLKSHLEEENKKKKRCTKLLSKGKWYLI